MERHRGCWLSTIKAGVYVVFGKGEGVRCGVEPIPLHGQLVNTTNKISPCQGYQYLLDHAYEGDEVMIYSHDDVIVHDPMWRNRVEDLFESKANCVVVGLGGATALGHSDLYKRPFRISDMARRGYCSNQTDWQTHGWFEPDEKRVAVVDAFFMAIRTDFLKQVGGWPVEHLTHHCLDLWVCLEVARRGKEVWMTGVECTHLGGGTSTKAEYQEAKWLQGGSAEQDHLRPHEWLYDEYRDVLPLEVKS